MVDITHSKKKQDALQALWDKQEADTIKKAIK